MKKWKLIIALISVIPATLIAYRERMPQTQKEVESEAIATRYQLQIVREDSDFFTKDDYYKAVVDIYTKALERYPESVELGQWLQDLTHERCNDNSIAQAERIALKDSLDNYYKDLYEKNPKSISNIYLYARTLDDDEMRLKLSDEILKLDKRSCWGYELRGWAFFKLGRYEEAEKTLKRAIESDSTIYDVYLDLAMLYQNPIRSKELTETFLKAYELAPHPMLILNQFWVVRNKISGIGDYESVLRLDKARFRKRTKVEKNLLTEISYEAHVIANTYQALGQSDSARQLFDYRLAYTALIDSERQSWVLFERACLEASCGNEEKAINLLDQCQQKGFTGYAYLATDSALQFFKDDPKFNELSLRMKDAAKIAAVSSPLNTSAPDFTLVSFTGDTVSLSSLRGKPVVLDFWMYCCAGAGAYTLKVLEEFQKKHPEIPVYGVGCGVSDVSAVADAFSQWGVKLPSLVSTPEVKDAYGVIGTPYILLIDSKGIMKYYIIGYGHGEAADQTLLDKLEWWLEAVK